MPDCNGEEIEKVARFLKPFKNISKVRVIPYHNYAGSKYEALNMANTLRSRLPTDEELEVARNLIKNITKFVVPT